MDASENTYYLEIWSNISYDWSGDRNLGVIQSGKEEHPSDKSTQKRYLVWKDFIYHGYKLNEVYLMYNL
jgi:hypothetical protein